ncbi:hypothetical protein ACLOJK_025345 [Asimina triloba]
MAATVSFAAGFPSSLTKSEFRIRSRRPVRVQSQLHGRSEVASLDRTEAEAIAGGNGAVKKSSGGGPVTSKHRAPETLELFYDDGYGSKSVVDYLDVSRELIKPDGGPPRWFCPVECRQPIKGAPVLLFLPVLLSVLITECGVCAEEMDVGEPMKKWSASSRHMLHMPVVRLDSMIAPDGPSLLSNSCKGQKIGLEGFSNMVRLEHAATPNKPIYIVGDSFGGCLALAVAARNPSIDLVLVLSNPATSFGRSPLQPWFPALEALPNELHVTVPYLLSFVMGM